MRRMLGASTFDAALDRMIRSYEDGDRVVVSFSGGKDSTVALEVCIAAASQVGRLPVEVVMRDEEVMFPGTFEYCERVAARPEIDFHWVIANQPVVNIFNRKEPYFWVFDPLVDPEDWVRKPPATAYHIEDQFIQALTSADRFPPPPGQRLLCVTGLRTDESPNRIRGLHSAGGHITKVRKPFGFHNCHPIYDLHDGDVWKAILENGWDYNIAYDVMTRFKIARRNMRIAPPTQRAAQLQTLRVAAAYDPAWFARVCTRLPGVRTAVQFGRVALEPRRDLGEEWKAVYERECIEEAPQWVGERCAAARDEILRRHSSHSSQPFPEARQCVRCGTIGSWMRMAKDLYMGDPFSFSCSLPPIEPEQFRPGAGTWGKGRPTW